MSLSLVKAAALLPSYAPLLFRSATCSRSICNKVSRAQTFISNQQHRPNTHLKSRVQKREFWTSSASFKNKDLIPKDEDNNQVFDPEQKSYRILESDIKILTLQKGKWADRVRQPQQQLQCTDGSAMGYEDLYPNQVLCQNLGVDPKGKVNWEFKFSKLDNRVNVTAAKITFEGWDGPSDKYVRSGSGVVRIKLDFVSGAIIDNNPQQPNNSNRNYAIALLIVALAGVAIYSLTKSDKKEPPSQAPSKPPEQPPKVVYVKTDPIQPSKLPEQPAKIVEVRKDPIPPSKPVQEPPKVVLVNKDPTPQKEAPTTIINNNVYTNTNTNTNTNSRAPEQKVVYVQQDPVVIYAKPDPVVVYKTSRPNVYPEQQRPTPASKPKSSYHSEKSSSYHRSYYEESPTYSSSSYPDHTYTRTHVDVPNVPAGSRDVTVYGKSGESE